MVPTHVDRIGRPIYFCGVLKGTRRSPIPHQRTFSVLEFVHALGEPGIDDDEEDEEEEVLSPGY